MNLVLRWLISGVALWLTALLMGFLPDGMRIQTGDAVSVLVVVAILAVVNALIRPLVKLFALPLTCLTFGLFGLVINALLFWLASALYPAGLEVDGFLAALIGSLVMGAVNGLLQSRFLSQRERV